MNNVAIIPARGGSKGLFKKNIKPLAGKPLIAWTIETALKCSLIDRVIVSTDDKEISDISTQYGAEVPILRPTEISKDDTPDFPVYDHLIKWLRVNDNYKPNIVIWLRPTSPLRTIEDIEGAFKIINYENTYFVRSVTECKYHPYWVKKIDNGFLIPFLNDFDTNVYYQRQLLPKVYIPNGAVDIIKCDIAHDLDGFYIKNARPYFMPLTRSIDIDDEDDFIIAEYLLKKYEKNN